MSDAAERQRRWALVLMDDSDLEAEDRRVVQALAAIYAPEEGSRRGGLRRSAPRVARWLEDIRRYFPAPVALLLQKDALERLHLRQLLLEPELLATLQADVNLVAELISLRHLMPEQARASAREVVAKVVAALLERLEQRTRETLRGALQRSRRTRRPRPADIDWPRTIQANLRHWQPDLRALVPERLVGFARRQRRVVDLEEVILCIDQSGSMATSVVYASIFAAVMASLPALTLRLVCFDTAVLDLSDQLEDPVEILFGVQLGGGTDINQAIAYCETKIEQRSRCHLVLLSDLFEGGKADELLARLARLVTSGVNLIVLLALTDLGAPGYDAALAGKVAALGVPVFACTPDQFPGLMAAALNRQDLAAWAASEDIKPVAAA